MNAPGTSERNEQTAVQVREKLAFLDRILGEETKAFAGNAADAQIERERCVS